MICFYTQSNYADNNALYSIGSTIESVKKAISNDFRIIENWFHENLIVLNAKKCYYTCFGIGNENDDLTEQSYQKLREENNRRNN